MKYDDGAEWQLVEQLLQGAIDRLVARVKSEGRHPDDYDDETWAAMVEQELDRA